MKFRKIIVAFLATLSVVFASEGWNLDDLHPKTNETDRAFRSRLFLLDRAIIGRAVIESYNEAEGVLNVKIDIEKKLAQSVLDSDSIMKNVWRIEISKEEANRLLTEAKSYDITGRVQADSSGNALIYTMMLQHYLIYRLFPFENDIKNRFVFEDGITLTRKNKEIKYVNKNGDLITESQFEDGHAFYKGTASVKQNGKWGFIDKSGNFVIPAKYEQTYRSFHEDMLAVKEEGKWGFIDRSARWVIEPKFENGGLFEYGRAFIEENKKAGMIDKEGNWVVEPKFESVALFMDQPITSARENGNTGLINTDGQWVLEPRFDDLTAVCYANHAISPAKKDGKYGLIDKQGNWVMEPKFQWIGCFKKGLALVRDNLKEGIIDESGAYVLKPIFDKIDFITDTTPEIIGVEKDKKHGFIDRNGQWIIEPKFKRLRFFTPDGIAVASEDGKRYGLINRNAEWVVEPKFDEINPFSDGIAEAKVDDKWGYINTKGHWVITPKKLYIIK